MGEASVAAVTAIAGKLEQRVAAFVREHRLPGASAGIVVGDELAWSFGYGFADVDARRPHDEHTIFRIASITKTFTATAIMQLRDEGRVHLDDPAVAYLPELRAAASPFGAIETVTIRRMLSHESGLMGDPPGARWFHDEYEFRPEGTSARSPSSERASLRTCSRSTRTWRTSCSARSWLGSTAGPTRSRSASGSSRRST
jgi:CubicO group peptidase (beta-lactamase class C family)